MSDERTERQPASAGFTLVELIVAIAITATLSLAIFGLYGTTSDHLRQADSMGETVDMARFTVEQLRSVLRNAGSFGTPDSRQDPWVKPDPEKRSGATSLRVVGIASYDGWQDDRSPMPKDLQTANEDKNLGLTTSFDGFIVIGAYDFPLTFEIGDIASTGKAGHIFANERGAMKLRINNPFTTKVGNQGYDFTKKATYDPIIRDSEYRLVRLLDPKGYSQFVGMDSNAAFDQSGTITTNNLALSFEQPVYFRTGAERYGLAPPTQQSDDQSYQASFLDAYWYHVIQDPADPRNFQLVRERLDAPELVKNLDGSWSGLDPTTYRAGTAQDYVVIAERVVDFQIWFDCATSASKGNIQKGSWNVGWKTPTGNTQGDTSKTTPTNGCLNLSSPEPGRVRIAHLRLSMRSDSERTDLEHNPFPPPPTSNGSRRLRSFDIYPDARGAAQVYTTQLDFELPNFAIKNVH